MSLGMLSDCVFNKTRWRPRGFSGIKEIKSVTNRIRSWLISHLSYTEHTGPFREHDKLADSYSSSADL